VVAKASNSEFWQTVKQGATFAAATCSDVKLSVLAPACEINIDQQVNILEDLGLTVMENILSLILNYRQYLSQSLKWR
jgi:hypothetical protein